MSAPTRLHTLPAAASVVYVGCGAVKVEATADPGKLSPQLVIEASGGRRSRFHYAMRSGGRLRIRNRPNTRATIRSWLPGEFVPCSTRTSPTVTLRRICEFHAWGQTQLAAAMIAPPVHSARDTHSAEAPAAGSRPLGIASLTSPDRVARARTAAPRSSRGPHYISVFDVERCLCPAHDRGRPTPATSLRAPAADRISSRLPWKPHM